MTSSHQKDRWRLAYDQQPPPEALQGGVRQFNGYRHPRTYTLLKHSLARATHTWHGWNILDAGCGSGDTGAFLNQNNHVTGFDFSHSMLRRAQLHYANVVLGDVERLPFSTGQFNGLVAVGVWQCLAPNTPFLGEAARVVQRRGEVVLGWVLNAEHVLYRRGVSFRLDSSVQMNLLSVAQINSLLADANLTVKEIYAVVFPFAVLKLHSVPVPLRPFALTYTVRCIVS